LTTLKLDYRKVQTTQEIKKQFRILASTYHPDQVEENERERATEKMKTFEQARCWLLENFAIPSAGSYNRTHTSSGKKKKESQKRRKREKEEKQRKKEEELKKQKRQDKKKRKKNKKGTLTSTKQTTCSIVLKWKIKCKLKLGENWVLRIKVNDVWHDVFIDRKKSYTIPDLLPGRTYKIILYLQTEDFEREILDQIEIMTKGRYDASQVHPEVNIYFGENPYNNDERRTKRQIEKERKLEEQEWKKERVERLKREKEEKRERLKHEKEEEKERLERESEIERISLQKKKEARELARRKKEVESKLNVGKIKILNRGNGRSSLRKKEEKEKGPGASLGMEKIEQQEKIPNEQFSFFPTNSSHAPPPNPQHNQFPYFYDYGQIQDVHETLVMDDYSFATFLQENPDFFVRLNNGPPTEHFPTQVFTELEPEVYNYHDYLEMEFLI